MIVPHQPLRGLRIWITRPLEQSEPLKKALERLGAHCDVVPMIKIEKRSLTAEEIRSLAAIKQVNALIFTSRNAVLQSQCYWPQLQACCDKSTKFFAVGEGTREQLRGLGVFAVMAPEQSFNSEALLKHAALQQVQSQQIVIVSGEGGRDELEKILRQRQATVFKLAVYRRIAPTVLPQMIQEVDVVILTSGEGLSNFFQAYGVHHLQKLPLLVISDRMAVLARRHGFHGVIIQASNATTDSIVEAMIQWRM